jgi:hypothetical protein
MEELKKSFTGDFVSFKADNPRRMSRRNRDPISSWRFCDKQIDELTRGRSEIIEALHKRFETLSESFNDVIPRLENREENINTQFMSDFDEIRATVEEMASPEGKMAIQLRDLTKRRDSLYLEIVKANAEEIEGEFAAYLKTNTHGFPVLDATSQLKEKLENTDVAIGLIRLRLDSVDPTEAVDAFLADNSEAIALAMLKGEMSLSAAASGFVEKYRLANEEIDRNAREAVEMKGSYDRRVDELWRTYKPDYESML